MKRGKESVKQNTEDIIVVSPITPIDSLLLNNKEEAKYEEINATVKEEKSTGNPVEKV